MTVGSRFRLAPATVARVRTALGAALIGGAIAVGSLGGVVAQEASPAASPVASPVAIAAWIDDIAIDTGITANGDSTTVGVIVGDVLEINAAEFESRPFVALQTANATSGPIVAVLLTAPGGFDAAGFTLPGEVSGLPEGVTPYGSYPVPAGAQATAVFPDLPEGTYVLATTSGLAISFVVTPTTEIDVPDIFATPAS